MALALMIGVYTLIGTALLPIAVLVALCSRRGRAFFLERIGFWKASKHPVILIHGASLGEIQGLLPLAKDLKSKYPDYEIVMSCTSNTGREAAEKAGFTARILPFDIYWLYIISFAELNLRVCITSETEIWPGLIGWLKFNRVPWIIVNGRISDQSWDEYTVLSPVLRPFIATALVVGVADDASFRRFNALGVPFEHLKKTGNTKYDFVVPHLTENEKASLRKELVGDVSKIVVLGSLRPGEELIWNPVIRNILNSHKDVGFILAPRHPEKFIFFAESMIDADIAFTRRSEGRCDKVLLLDSLGELSKVYSISDVAFIGGSLAPFGGHNPLEAMVQGCALMMGPSTYVVTEIVEHLKGVEALLSISNAEECEKALRELLDDPEKLSGFKERARTASVKFQGATERTIDMISPILKERK
jgi:3-deoxy-D-manno-octulosonic-acid transferase